MLQFTRKPVSGGAAGRPSSPAMVEPMEGRVLMSATTLGSPVTFTYTVTNTSVAPDGRQLVVTIKDGPTG